jgi:hypothetical protein
LEGRRMEREKIEMKLEMEVEVEVSRCQAPNKIY